MIEAATMKWMHLSFDQPGCVMGLYSRDANLLSQIPRLTDNIVFSAANRQASACFSWIEVLRHLSHRPVLSVAAGMSVLVHVYWMCDEQVPVHVCTCCRDICVGLSACGCAAARLADVRHTIMHCHWVLTVPHGPNHTAAASGVDVLWQVLSPMCILVQPCMICAGSCLTLCVYVCVEWKY